MLWRPPLFLFKGFTFYIKGFQDLVDLGPNPATFLYKGFRARTPLFLLGFLLYSTQFSADCTQFGADGTQFSGAGTQFGADGAQFGGDGTRFGADGTRFGLNSVPLDSIRC